MPSDRAAFLDRDGTLIEDADYLADPERIAFVPGAFEGMRLLRDSGFRLVVVTNQSGIARGLFSTAQYRAIEERIERIMEAEGVVLDGVFFCPHHPDFTGPCECRKPGLGMYRDAARKLGLDLAASVYIGDRVRDVEPGVKLGGQAILIRRNAGNAVAEQVPGGVDVVPDLYAAARLVVEKSGSAP